MPRSAGGRRIRSNRDQEKRNLPVGVFAPEFARARMASVDPWPIIDIEWTDEDDAQYFD